MVITTGIILGLYLVTTGIFWKDVDVRRAWVLAARKWPGVARLCMVIVAGMKQWPSMAFQVLTGD